MDKNRLCYMVRSRYPEALGIRKKLQQVKIKRLYRFLLSEEEIAMCENDPSKKEEVVKPYLKKYAKYLRPAVAEMKDIFENADLYKNRKDKKQIKYDMMFCRLAYGFIPSEYVSFDFIDKTPEQRKAYVSDIFTNDFGYSVNNIKKLQTILDKGDSAQHFAEYFKRDFIVIKSEKDYDIFHSFIEKHPIFVEKKVFSSMGKGTRLVDINETGKTEKEYFDSLISAGRYLLEEKVIQDPAMSRYNLSSVNTIRSITFVTTEGVVIPYCFMRVGRNGSFVDNGGSGGLLVGIDSKNGEMISDGIDEYGNKYLTHPDTGVYFKGNVVPKWDELIEFCKVAAAKEDEIGYLSWDLALTDKGWDVIEVNEVGQLIGPQMVLNRGIKAEVEDYLTRMNKVI